MEGQNQLPNGIITDHQTAYSLEHTSDYVHLQFTRPHRIVSSAVLNGGFVKADHILNLKVPLTADYNVSPEKTLRIFSHRKLWTGTTVGLMTAALMDTFVLRKESINNTEVAIMVTAGLSNARRAGDKADYRNRAGTINIIMYASGQLTPAAMVEAVMIITEAKTAALQELQILSPVSKKIATGTGTDAIVVVSGYGPDKFEYCGKHLLLGEIIGRTVIDAVRVSVKKALR